MAVTHDMIATKLGINRTTVTKALKGDDSIKKATRKKVLETATLMGYDFKQSQQNRREGKRYFVHDDVRFRIVDSDTDAPIIAGPALLTNLSCSGAMIQLRGMEREQVPLHPFHVLIEYTDAESGEPRVLPRARIIRINFYGHVEMGTKFLEGSGLDPAFLEGFEARAFSRVDEEAKAENAAVAGSSADQDARGDAPPADPTADTTNA